MNNEDMYYCFHNKEEKEGPKANSKKKKGRRPSETLNAAVDVEVLVVGDRPGPEDGVVVERAQASTPRPRPTRLYRRQPIATPKPAP